jgi:adenosylcobinamide-GDP ribazoletransferase
MRTAFAFLTRLPFSAPPLTAESMSRAVPWFPLVGLFVGAVMAGVRALAEAGVGDVAATLLALFAGVLVTGGLHEDGLADCADAIGAHATRGRKREILHDARIGTYGALALLFCVAFSVAALAPLDAWEFAQAVVVGQVLGRASIVLVAVSQVERFGSADLLRPSRRAGALSTGTALLASVALGGGAAAGAFAASTVAGGWMAATVVRSLGGINGDALGAVNAVVTVAAYGAFGALAGPGS